MADATSAMVVEYGYDFLRFLSCTRFETIRSIGNAMHYNGFKQLLIQIVSVACCFCRSISAFMDLIWQSIHV